MSHSNLVMAARELGALPLSVGTSLAIEALKVGPSKHYRGFYVNLHTLFRNLHGSIPATAIDGIDKQVWIRTIIEEIFMIAKIVKEEISPDLKVVFYCPTYASIRSVFKKALLRELKTDNQRVYAAIQSEVLLGIKNYSAQIASRGIDLQFVDSSPPKVVNGSIIMTHHVVDLVDVPWDTRLLESHTGRLKDRSMWHTKFAGKADSSMIPFNKLTLSVLGDPTTIAPQPLGVRKALYALAMEKKWTSVLTYDYVKFSVDHMRDYGVRELFRAMF